MQQNKNKNNNLLSIPAQVLAYSFQYLSYKNVCKIQHTCIYFTYLNKRYPALTHYYLRFDRTLFLNIVKHRTDLHFLSYFKHIAIKYVYYNLDSRYSEYAKKRHTELFKYILKTIITQNISGLQILEINVIYDYEYLTNRARRELPQFNLLLHILNEFDGLSLQKLIWNDDIFKITNNYSMQQLITEIQTKLISKVNSLKHFEFGIDDYNLMQGNLPVSTLTRSIIIPAINNYTHLESLKLTCSWNVLHKQYKLIPLISSQMKHLKILTMLTVVHFDDFDYEIGPVQNNYCSAVKTLDLTLKFVNC
eukprot:474207_1